jgi:hypothetical protein
MILKYVPMITGKTRLLARVFGLRRQSEAATALLMEQRRRYLLAKAASRFARRSPK